MSFFKKKTFYPPEVAETTIGLSGRDVLSINQQLGYELADEDTTQKAWSEYMKVQYALTLNVIAAKRSDISKDFSYFMKNSIRSRINQGLDSKILQEEIKKKSWFSDVLEYQALPLDKIASALYKNIVPLLPYVLDERMKTTLYQYLTQRIPFIQEELMKLNFDIYSTRAELKANSTSTQ